MPELGRPDLWELDNTVLGQSAACCGIRACQAELRP